MKLPDNPLINLLLAIVLSLVLTIVWGVMGILTTYTNIWVPFFGWATLMFLFFEHTREYNINQRRGDYGNMETPR